MPTACASQSVEHPNPKTVHRPPHRLDPSQANPERLNPRQLLPSWVSMAKMLPAAKGG